MLTYSDLAAIAVTPEPASFDTVPVLLAKLHTVLTKYLAAIAATPKLSALDSAPVILTKLHTVLTQYHYLGSEDYTYTGTETNESFGSLIEKALADHAAARQVIVVNAGGTIQLDGETLSSSAGSLVLNVADALAASYTASGGGTLKVFFVS